MTSPAADLVQVLADLESIRDDDRTPDWKPIARWHADRIFYAIRDAQAMIRQYDQALDLGLAAGSEPF